MLQITPKHRIFIAVQSIDFRAGIDGLAAHCRRSMGNDPTNGHVFVFRNRAKTAIKVLLYDSQGFWLCHKRLSRGSFQHWPKQASSVIELSVAQLQALIYNGNPFNLNEQAPWRAID